MSPSHDFKTRVRMKCRPNQAGLFPFYNFYQSPPKTKSESSWVARVPEGSPMIQGCSSKEDYTLVFIQRARYKYKIKRTTEMIKVIHETNYGPINQGKLNTFRKRK